MSGAPVAVTPAERPTLYAGTGVFAGLPSLLEKVGIRRLVVIASAGALARTRVVDTLAGAATAVESFSSFSPNPRLEEALAAVALVERLRPDAIVAVGGASTLDVAKLARLLPLDRDQALAAIAGDAGQLRRRSPQLVLIPTTAGPGSEVTRFAAAYVDALKQSLDHDRVLADSVVADPALLHTCPWPVMASCALDGLAQAIESTLALRATTASRASASRSIPPFQTLLRSRGMVSDDLFEELSGASLDVGSAIDVSRTMAGHAFAYPTTSRFGVPHGLAATLHLLWLLPYIGRTVGSRCVHPDGAGAVQVRVRSLAKSFGGRDADDLAAGLEQIVEEAGFEPRLGSYGVRSSDVPAMVRDALRSIRARNSPVSLSGGVAERLIRERI